MVIRSMKTGYGGEEPTYRPERCCLWCCQPARLGAGDRCAVGIVVRVNGAKCRGAHSVAVVVVAYVVVLAKAQSATTASLESFLRRSVAEARKFQERSGQGAGIDDYAASGWLGGLDW